MKKGYTTLLLDMDGTFLDFEAAERSAFLTAMTRHGYPAGEEEYACYQRINHGLWEAFERGEIDKPTLLSTRFGRLFEALGVSGDGAAFEREYQALLGEGAQLMEGAEEVLSHLAKRYALYVVTNGVERTQRNRLRLSGIDRFMTDLFISEAIGWQKPQKEFFDACFARLSEKDRSRMLIIGDSLTSDIQGGFNAGIDTCWFNPKGKKRPEGFERPESFGGSENAALPENAAPPESFGRSENAAPWENAAPPEDGKRTGENGREQKAGKHLDLEIRSLYELKELL